MFAFGVKVTESVAFVPGSVGDVTVKPLMIPFGSLGTEALTPTLAISYGPALMPPRLTVWRLGDALIPTTLFAIAANVGGSSSP